MDLSDRPSDAAILERARSLVNEGCWTVALQLRRLHGTEPGDEEFLTRQLADFQFLIVTLRRLRRAALIATNVASAADQIHEAITRFDTALPGLATMRNVGEHIDDYDLDRTTRHHRNVNRRMLQVASWDDTTYRWLGIEFDIDAALPAAQQLFLTVRAAQQDHVG